MTPLQAVGLVVLGMLAFSGVAFLLLLSDYIINKYPVLGVIVTLIGIFLGFSFLVWLIGNIV